MKKIILLVATLAGLAACGSSGGAIDPVQDQKEAIQTQKNCADPTWKEAHLGIWYSVCRPNDAVR